MSDKVGDTNGVCKILIDIFLCFRVRIWIWFRIWLLDLDLDFSISDLDLLDLDFGFLDLYLDRTWDSDFLYEFKLSYVLPNTYIYWFWLILCLDLRYWYIDILESKCSYILSYWIMCCFWLEGFVLRDYVWICFGLVMFDRCYRLSLGLYWH